MTVKDLKKALEDYNDEAEVRVVVWSTGETIDPTIGCDDDDEYTDYCSIGID